MKVLFLNPSNSPYRDGFYKELAKLLDVQFVFYFDDAEGVEGVDCEILKGERKFPGYNRGFNTKLISKIWKSDCDVIVASDPCSFAAHVGYQIAQLRKKKFVIWSELWKYPNTFTAKLAKWYIKGVVKHADACIAAGSKAKEFMEDWGAKDVVIAPNSSFDVKELPEVERSLPDKFILNIGVIRPCDGQLELIRAFKELNNDEVILMLVGNEGDEEYAKKCKLEAEGANVVFEGYVDHEELRPYYEQCLFLVSSMVPVKGVDPYASWEMTLNEASSAGKPLLATTAVAGAFDLIDQGRNGFIVSHECVEMNLAGYLEKMMLSDLVTMGQESRNIYIESFTHKNMAEKFAQKLQEVKKCLE